MQFPTRHQARAAMLARAEISHAPGLALIRDPRENSFYVVESDENGVVIIRRRDLVLDTVWTSRRGGVEELVFKNAYTVDCAYATHHSRREIVVVDHGDADLDETLHTAIEAANASDCWRSCDDGSDTFIEAIAEGYGVDPWRRDVSVPEAFTDDGPWPIIVIRVTGGRIAEVEILRGDAHVFTVERGGEALVRPSNIRLHGELGKLTLTNLTGRNDPESLPKGFLKEIGAELTET